MKGRREGQARRPRRVFCIIIVKDKSSEQSRCDQAATRNVSESLRTTAIHRTSLSQLPLTKHQTAVPNLVNDETPKTRHGSNTTYKSVVPHQRPFYGGKHDFLSFNDANIFVLYGWLGIDLSSLKRDISISKKAK